MVRTSCDGTGHVVDIVIVLDVLVMWSVFLSDMLVVGSNIAIGLYLLDMWSLLCVPYVGVGV